MRMKIEIYIKGRDYYATGYYNDGEVTVSKGSTIKYIESKSFKMNEAAKIARNDSEKVKDGSLLINCIFSSPSTAAQFVTGGSRDGYDTWKVEKGVSLGDFLEAHGIRSRRRKMKE